MPGPQTHKFLQRRALRENYFVGRFSLREFIHYAEPCPPAERSFVAVPRYVSS